MALFSRGAAMLAAILAARFLGFVARMSIVPFFPELMSQYGVGYTEMGTLMTAYLVGYAVAMFPAGLLADRFDSRRLIALGLLVQAITFPATVMAPHWTLAAAARFVMGVGTALLFSPGFKLMIMHLPQRILGLALSMQEVTIALGILFALSGAPLLARWVPFTTQHVAAGVACAVMAAAFLAVKLPPAQREVQAVAAPSLRLLFNRHLMLVAVVFAVSNFAVSGYLSWLPPFVQDGLAWGRDGAAMVSLVQLLADAGSALLVGRLTDRMPRRSFILLGASMATAVGAFLLAVSTGVAPVLAAAVLLGVAIPMTYVPLTAISTGLIAPERVGAAMGLINTLSQVTSALAGAGLGWLVDSTGSFRSIWWAVLAIMALQIPLVLLMRDRRSAGPSAAP